MGPDEADLDAIRAGEARDREAVEAAHDVVAAHTAPSRTAPEPRPDEHTDAAVDVDEAGL